MLRTSALALALAAVNGGCFMLGNDTQFVEGDDVRLELPDSVQARDVDTSQIRGDVHDLVLVTTERVNTWVTTVVEVTARVVEFLDDVPETSRDGEFRVYGPYADRDGRDLSWLVRIGAVEDGSKSEIYVGLRDAKSQADMDLLMSGTLIVGEGTRSGGFTIDFDVVEKYDDVKGSDERLNTYAGVIELTFDREVETEKKSIDLAFKDFTVVYDGFLDSDTFVSNDTYNYHRDADGGVTFHLSLLGDWDEYGWSGPEQEEMTLEAAWTAKGEGRSRGTVVEVEGQGDLKHGDVQVDECFGADGYLTWRQVSEAYLVDVPGYDFGDPGTCALPVEALPSG